MLRLREAISFLLFHQGEFAEARAIQEGNLGAFREAGETVRVAIGSGSWLCCGRRTGSSQALARSRPSPSPHSAPRETPRAWSGPSCLAAAVAVEEGDLDRAARLSGAGDILREPLGEMATPMRTLGIDDPAAVARAALGDEAFERAYAAGRALTLDQVVALVRGSA